MRYKPGLDPVDRKEITKAVLIAGLTALATGIVQWGIDALRDKYGPSKEEDKSKDSDK